MSALAEKIITEAMSLPVSERAFLAEQLIESLDVTLDESLSPAWKAEIHRRCCSIDDGSAMVVPADEVFKRIAAKFS
jgi:putative addiction module component (TIGR02574 family)